jgi:hypothetical protein
MTKEVEKLKESNKELEEKLQSMQSMHDKVCAACDWPVGTFAYFSSYGVLPAPPLLPVYGTLSTCSHLDNISMRSFSSLT